MILIKDIINFLGKDVINIYGNIENVYVKHLRPLESTDNETLDWIGYNKISKQMLVEKSVAKVIVCDNSIVFSNTIKSQNKLLIQVKNPKLTISLIADKFFIKKPDFGIHPSSFIHPNAKIAKSVYIASNCSIGDCIIEDETYIYPNVTIYDGVNIGKNVIIQAGAVIGTDGLGCERKENGELVKFAHLGKVIIKDNVEIGANCQIARGALSDTIIGKGTKINGLSFIAHNCVIGNNVLITGNSMLAGSVKIEDNVTIYSKVIVREQRKIGKGSIIGMGAVVTKDVPAWETWIGNPAKKIKKNEK